MSNPVQRTHPARTVPPADEEDWITIAEAVVVARVSRRTIYNWMEQGRIEVRETPSGRKRVRKASLLRRRETGEG